jgi:ribosomal protein S18 acetylase RimI-like enzyme
MIDSSSATRQIRQATADDREALYDICLRTADAGVDATALYGKPRLPGSIWAVPYAVLEPDFAFVLADEQRAIGYVLGVPDTAAFVARLQREWWPQVRATFADTSPRSEAEANALSRIATPEHPLTYLLADYPAHLHINVLPEAQSGGWGRQLVERELAALRQAGVPGVHLGVSPTNERAKGFYRHLGFDDVSRDGKVTFAMSLR